MPGDLLTSKQQAQAAAFLALAKVTRLLERAIANGHEFTVEIKAELADAGEQDGYVVRKPTGNQTIVINVVHPPVEAPWPAKP